MKRQRLRFILLTVFLILASTEVFATVAWEDDANRANGYFWKQDYNAAWLFYERALAHGCSDGVILFRAARSFEKQQIIDNPELLSSLFAAAHYFLMEKYPNDTGIEASLKHFDSSTVINRRFLRKLYKQVGGKTPPIKTSPLHLKSIKPFILQSFGDTRQFFSLIRSSGVKSAIEWARPRAWNLLALWISISLITGICLPVVMALAVAAEGRKSHVTAYACLLHWGVLGIHRFYLNRWKSGLIWLCTAGLFGLGVFFDIFLTGAYVRIWNEDNRDRRPPGTGKSSLPRSNSPPSRRVGPIRKKSVRPQQKESSADDFMLDDDVLSFDNPSDFEIPVS